MINIGIKNFEILIKEISKLKYVNSIFEQNHKRNVTEYTFKNEQSKNTILSAIGIDQNKYKVKDSIHMAEYNVDSHLRTHVDGECLLLMMIIEDNFMGGDFILKNKIVNFKLNGDVIYVNGMDEHSLTPITHGTRKIIILDLQSKSII